ncbi:hypothetical protein H9P43_005606 [Blastocladiella emersonii ATCC 22665]|nr:hypothetical protein H9P43_005606 [Blastocladiella emersonii ATCC 22665]
MANLNLLEFVDTLPPSIARFALDHCQLGLDVIPRLLARLHAPTVTHLKLPLLSLTGHALDALLVWLRDASSLVELGVQRTGLVNETFALLVAALPDSLQTFEFSFNALDDTIIDMIEARALPNLSSMLYHRTALSSEGLKRMRIMEFGYWNSNGEYT